MKLGTVAAEQGVKFVVEGFLGPGDKASPVVLELFPDDLDQIEFGTIRRQVNQECSVINEPAVENVLGNIVMNARIIQNDQRRSIITLGDDTVEKVNHAFAIDSAGMDFRVQLLGAEIQCSQYRARAVLGRFRGVRLTARRPRALHRRRGTETGLVKVNQPDDTLSGGFTRKRQRLLSSDEFVFEALFLS